MSTKQMPTLEPDVEIVDKPSPKQPGVGWRRALLVVVGLAAAGALSIKARAKEQVALSAETARLAVTTISPATRSPSRGRTNWSYPAASRHTRNRRFTRGPMAICCTGTKTSARPSRRATYWPIWTRPKLTRNSPKRRRRASRWWRPWIWRAPARTAGANCAATDSVSQQELDQKTSDYAQAQANLGAADANVRRLQQLESFKHVYAPFTGVLTRRNVDIGALVNAGNGGSGKELFNLALIDPLRVYVSVPEADAPAMRAGMRVWIALAEFPASRFAGTVVRTANAIDQNTRTLLTEVDVPNKAGRLLPGAYAQVHFNVPVNGRRLTVPSSAMLFRSEGPCVAVVGPGDRVQLRPIVIGRDFGTSLEILQGVSASDRVVQNPPDSLASGQVVHVVVDGSVGKPS